MNVRSAVALAKPPFQDKRNLDVVCLSHLRWNFVYQRPQHLLTRCAAHRRVFFFEEPVIEQGAPRLSVECAHPGVCVVVPHLPPGLTTVESEDLQRSLLGDLFATKSIEEFILWYYTPMALGFTNHLEPKVIVYDCMDELSAFKGAPKQLLPREAELFEQADLVFTGGQALYEAKRRLHHNIHAFPSSVDRAHFEQARSAGATIQGNEKKRPDSPLAWK